MYITNLARKYYDCYRNFGGNYGWDTSIRIDFMIVEELYQNFIKLKSNFEDMKNFFIFKQLKTRNNDIYR